MTKYNDQAIQNIAGTNMLSHEDLDFVQNNIAQLQDNWAKRQVFRTETEMVVSVLSDNKFPTPAAKYWQAIREQSVFYQELIRLSFEYRRNEIKIRQLEEKIEKASGYKQELLQIDLEEKLFGRLNMDSTAKDRIRELRSWDNILQELDDGSFDSQNVNTHQLESYTKRFENQVKTLNNSTPPADAFNITGLHQTANRVKNTGIGVCNTSKVALGTDSTLKAIK